MADRAAAGQAQCYHSLLTSSERLSQNWWPKHFFIFLTFLFIFCYVRQFMNRWQIARYGYWVWVESLLSFVFTSKFRRFNTGPLPFSLFFSFFFSFIYLFIYLLYVPYVRDFLWSRAWNCFLCRHPLKRWRWNSPYAAHCIVVVYWLQSALLIKYSQRKNLWMIT